MKNIPTLQLQPIDKYEYNRHDLVYIQVPPNRR